MAASSPRQLVILGVLGVVLVGVLYYELTPGDAPPARPLRPAPNARTPKDAAIAVDPVRLDVLTRTRPEPGEGDRDPFTFEARRPATSPTAGTGTSMPGPVVPTPVTVPQGPPPWLERRGGPGLPIGSGHDQAPRSKPDLRHR